MQIDALEADVDAARSRVLHRAELVTALRHALDMPRSQRERVAETRRSSTWNEADVRSSWSGSKPTAQRRREALRRANGALDASRIASTARESELASARVEHEWRSRDVRTGEQDLAALEARLDRSKSSTHSRRIRRCGADGARHRPTAMSGSRARVADYLEVEPRYERAVEACLGDLLQHVIVERHDQAAAGLSI